MREQNVLSTLGNFLRCPPQKSALVGRRIRDSLVRLSWRLTGYAGQAQRPEQKSAPQGYFLRGALVGRRFVWLRALPVLLAFLLSFAGPAAAFTNCAKEPDQCCYGIYKLDSTVCSGHGTCTNKVCYCNAYYAGNQCETEKACGSLGEKIMCSGSGTCLNDECWCDGTHGYGGFNCALKVQPQLQPATLAFGAQAVGAASAKRTATLSSQFEAATVSSIVIGGTDAGDFVLDGGCAAGTAVAAQGSCELGVSFLPTAPGARSATLTVVVGATTWPATLTLALSGSGIIETKSLLLDPDTAGRLYAGLDGAGVHVSSDGGATWTAATTQPANSRVKALARKSGTPLYAGTYGGGVFMAAAGTTAFVACAAQPGNLDVLSLALDAAGRLYAGTYGGIYVSAAACASWTALSAGLP
jgi:hypothetical protein